MKNVKLTDEVKASADYQNMVNLLAVYSEADNRLGELQTQTTRDYLETVDEHKAEYSKLQETLTKTEVALELIAVAHPEWFTTRKSIKTPYGVVKMHASSSLEVANEEATVLLIEKRAAIDTTFKASDFTRTVTVINREALEKLKDGELADLRVKRVHKNNFSVSAAAMDMGKAVKETPAEAAV